MNFVKTSFIALSAAFLMASCGESTKTGLTQFDACNCATVEDMNSPDYAKCKELRKDSIARNRSFREEEASDSKPWTDHFNEFWLS
jgi:hypothetical protein